MTPGDVPDGEIEYRSVGAPDAARTVIVLRTGPFALVDPDPSVTAARDVRVVLIQLDAPELDDPPAFGGQTPAAATAASLATLAQREGDGAPFSLVGERATGAITLSLAAELGDEVDRLALVSVPAPDGPLARDVAAPVLAGVSADTLLVNASDDPTAPRAAAEWHRSVLPRARAEVLDSASGASADERLSLSEVWGTVLDHVAPAAGLR